MIYPWYNLTEEPEYSDYTTKIEALMNSPEQCSSVILTKDKFKETALFNELHSKITVFDEYYIVSIKFPWVSNEKLGEFISYIYLYLWGVPVHVDPDWMYKDFPWNVVYYKDDIIASAYKLIELEYLYSLLIVIPKYINMENPFMNYMTFDRIKARITGALYDAKIYGQCNSADDASVQPTMQILL